MNENARIESIDQSDGVDTVLTTVPERRKASARIHQLWDILADHGNHEWEIALKYLLNVLCDQLQAENATWMGLVKLYDQTRPTDRKLNRDGWLNLHHREAGERSAHDPMRGWRIASALSLNPPSQELSRGRREAWKALDDKYGETSRVLATQAGHYRVRTLKGGLVNLKTFQKTSHYDFYYRQLQIEDRLWAIAPVSEYSEACLVIDKKTSGQRFSRNDIRWTSQCIQGLKWFFRQVLLSQGLAVATDYPTAYERKVINYLLAGVSEKVMADELGVTRGTAHQYCTRIYKKYNVKGRVEFMALWLSTGWAC